MTKVLVVGGGTGLTSAWLLEDQENVEVTLLEQSDRLGGHIDTREYRYANRMISHQPTGEEMASVASLRQILFVHNGDSYAIGFCDENHTYQQVKITDPSLLAFLEKQVDGEFLIPGSELDKFNQLLRENHSYQRVTTHIVEAGAEFMGTEKSYPLFNKICKYLRVDLTKFPLTMQFDNRDGSKIVLPPPLPPVVTTGKGNCSFFIPSDVGAKDHPIHFLNELKTLVNTELSILDAKKKLKIDNPTMTLQKFVDQYIASPVFKSQRKGREKFANEFLYPLLAAGWGVHATNDIKTFLAHWTMNYLCLGEEWHHAPQGLKTYIDKMRDQCTKIQIKLNTTVEKLEPTPTSSGVKYKVRLKDGLYLMKDGEPELFDKVIMATPANVTSAIMPDKVIGELKELKDKLSKVNYYHTKIVTHRDQRYASEYQSIAHTHTSDGKAANTTCKYFEYEPGESPIFRTWVLPGQEGPDPKDILEEIHYEHPVLDQFYRDAQVAIHKFQGAEGLYVGGILGGFNDSHESALSVAIRIAYAIYKLLKSQPKDVAASSDQPTAPLPTKAPGADASSSASQDFDRFSLFLEYLRTLDELDAQSSQLGAHEHDEGAHRSMAYS